MADGIASNDVETKVLAMTQCLSCKFSSSRPTPPALPARFISCTALGEQAKQTYLKLVIAKDTQAVTWKRMPPISRSAVRG